MSSSRGRTSSTQIGSSRSSRRRGERGENDDVAEAAADYREALALWRGRALGDLTFESFAANEAERLNELRLEALTERIDCDLRLGRHGELVGELEALVAEHPLRESLRGQLMLALYRSGRQADALEAYIETRRALRDELGLEPGPELRRLEQEILRHDHVGCSLPTHVDASRTRRRRSSHRARIASRRWARRSPLQRLLSSAYSR